MRIVFNAEVGILTQRWVFLTQRGQRSRGAEEMELCYPAIK
jgi:hypothetical protein